MFSPRRIRSVLAAGIACAGMCFAAAPALAATSATGMARINPGTAVSLNPQPIPPGFTGFGVAVSLNPQPLPPRVAGLSF
jgi:hypothetical protein